MKITEFGRQRQSLAGKVLINSMTVFTTKLYTRYYYAQTEEYQEGCDKHFKTEQEAKQYALENERGFGNSDTSYRYEIVKHDMENLKLLGEE